MILGWMKKLNTEQFTTVLVTWMFIIRRRGRICARAPTPPYDARVNLKCLVYYSYCFLRNLIQTIPVLVDCNLGRRQRGGRIFIHDTDIVDRGLKVLLFGLFSVAPSLEFFLPTPLTTAYYYFM